MEGEQFFSFLPTQSNLINWLIERGEGGVWTDRIPMFHFILWVGIRSNFAFFPILIFFYGLMLKVIVFLVILLFVVEKTCKTGKWNQDQERDIKRYPPSDFIRLLPKGRKTNFSCRKTKTNFHKLLFNYATTITVEKVFNSENKMNVNAS